MRLFGLIAFFLALAPVVAHAATYPWVQMTNDDIRVIDDTKIETAIRLEMIQRARETLDIVVYDQRADDVIAMPLLKAIRDAADRGVRVRFLTPWVVQTAKDPTQTAPRYLTDPPARTPVQYLLFGGQWMYRNGWKITDQIHEKLIIVDGEWMITTGRGHSDFYLNWVDTAFVIKGPLVTQSLRAFNQLWRTARSLSKLYSPPRIPGTSGRSHVPSFTPNFTPLMMNASEYTRALELVEWISGRAPTPNPRTMRARLLHYDFIRQMKALLTANPDYDHSRRIIDLRDPIVDEVASKLRTSSTSRLNIMAMILHPALKSAIVTAKILGRDVRIFTNGKDAFEGVAPAHLPWIAGLADMDDLFSMGLPSIMGFTRNNSQPYTYLHRKIAIMDNTVIFGSHNFNLPSTIANDEMSFEIEDETFASQMVRLHDRSVSRNGVAISASQVRRERTDTPVEQFLAEPLIGLF